MELFNKYKAYIRKYFKWYADNEKRKRINTNMYRIDQQWGVKIIC